MSAPTTHAAVPAPPDRAYQLFGPRLPLARTYVESLCTVAVDRGLFGPREPERVWERHVLPGAALGELVPPNVRVADVGSGAGLPGIPLVIARPDVRLTLVEPMQRRVQYLNEVAEALRLDITVVRARGESAAGVDVDVVVARAVAPLSRLLPLTLPLLGSGGTVLAVKGRSAETELHEAAAALAAASATAEVKTVGEGADTTRVVVVDVPPERVRSQARTAQLARARMRGAR